MTHILFLDFDGVLHPTSGPTSNQLIHAQTLADCLSPHVCEVVISSSWRHSWTIPELLSYLPKDLACKVTGATGDAYIGAHARFHEIQAWLDAHPRPGGVSWRALDDCGWEFPKGTTHLIACNPNTGLTAKELKEIRRWLR